MNFRLEELEEKYSRHLQPTVKLLQVTSCFPHLQSQLFSASTFLIFVHFHCSFTTIHSFVPSHRNPSRSTR